MLVRDKIAPVIERLKQLADCTVVHSTRELPISHRAYNGRYRSHYFGASWDRVGRSPYILMNEGPARHWNYLTFLAHEAGHAMDDRGYFDCLGYRPLTWNDDYRAELMACAFQIAVMRQTGAHETRHGPFWIRITERYLRSFDQSCHPDLHEVVERIGPNPLRI